MLINRLLFIICLHFLFATMLDAQGCPPARYKKLMREAQAAAFGRNPDYQLAVNKLFSAKTCQPDSEAVVNAAVLRVFEEVNRQRENAVRNEQEARRQQRQSKALYLASEAWNMRGTDPTQALRLLEVAYSLYPNHPSVLEKIVPTFYDGNVAGFYSLSFQHDFFTNQAYFSKNNQLVLTCTFHNIYIWDISGQLIKQYSLKDHLIEDVRFVSGDSAIVYYGDSVLYRMNLDDNGTWDSIVHQGRIISFDISTNDEILTVSENNAVNLIDKYGKLIEHNRFPAPTKGAVFSPDGSLIVSWAGKMAFVCGKEGKILDRFECTDPYYNIKNASLSPDNSMLSIAVGDTALLWRRGTNTVIRLPHSNSVRKAVFTPNGKLVLTIYDSSVAHMQMQNALLWDLQGQLVDTLNHTKTIRGISYSPDGTEILTTSMDSTAKLWDLQGNLLRIFRHNGGINSACFSKDGKQVLTASDDYTAKLWSRHPYQMPALSQSSNIEMPFFFGNDTFLVLFPTTIECLDTLELYRMDDLKARQVSFNAPLCAFDLSEKNNLALAGSIDGTIYLFDPQNPEKTSTVYTGSRISQISFSGSGKYFLAITGDTVLIYQTSRLKKIAVLAHKKGVKKAIFSADERFVLTLSGQNSVQRWDLMRSDGRPASYYDCLETINNIAFSPDGTLVIACTIDKRAVLWRSDGQYIRNLSHPAGVNAAVFSPDGKRIVTIADDFTVRLWDKNTGTAPINSMSFSGNCYAVTYRESDSMILVCWGQVYKIDLTYQLGGGVALFDSELNLVAQYLYPDGIEYIEFSNNGKMIAGSAWKGEVAIWLTPQGVLDWASANIAPLHKMLIKKYDLK